MCSRFYLDEWTEREVCRLVWDGGPRFMAGNAGPLHAGRVRFAPVGVAGLEPDGIGPLLAARDVRPSEAALVLLGSRESQENQEKLAAEKMRWGFLKQQEKGIFINARAETVLERPTFRDSARYRRCIIPAAGFYEWDRQKEIASFSCPDSHILYMAGIYQRFEAENRFVILTTDANESVSPVHDRMPLILEESELARWTAADRELEDMLCRRQVKLCRRQEYEQQRMEFV